MYIFLDESGNFKGEKNGHFVVGGFVTGDPRTTAKAFRKWQQSKFPGKKLRYRSEVKFSDSRVSDELRAKTLLYLTKQNLRIFYSFLKTKNIPVEFRTKKGLETGRLYNDIVIQTLEILFPTTDSELVVTLDRRQLKRVPLPEFRGTIRRHLLLKLPSGSAVYVNTIDSTTNPNIQIADWICGALYRYYTDRENGQQFYDTLHSSIVASAELFKDYWQNFNIQKTPRS